MVSIPPDTINLNHLIQNGPTTASNGISKELTLMPPPASNTSRQKPGNTFIITRDGATFLVHFDILAFSSPVFCSLLRPCASPSTYRIDETSPVFLCFLSLAYSRDLPVLTSFRALDNALAVATKYELTMMKKLLRGTLSDPSSPQFMDKDPVSTFEIALKHDFPKELALASRQLVQCTDIRDPQCLELLRTSPIGSQILNMLALRHSKLADILLSQGRGVVVVEDPNTLALLSCETCYAAAKSLKLKYVQWMMHWAQNAYETLSSSCLTTQDRLFGIGYILDMMSGGMSCMACRLAILANLWTYEAWMKNIKQKLEQCLLTELEAQIRTLNQGPSR
ncbi:hypothetical protein FRC08_013404 [Ceratobasidium sp. 394]|nr:hypothetical protein FRC08_013404 [Ceratobasidium sp. 394]KAG9083081.1 hypothetical protein FS749_006315 [Ceratobasidium sp. UAMH 11750]